MVIFQNLSKNGEMLKNIGEIIKKNFALIFFYTLDIKNIILNPKFYQHFLPSLVITLLISSRYFINIRFSHFSRHVTQPANASLNCPATITHSLFLSLSFSEKIEVDLSDFLCELRLAFRRFVYRITSHIHPFRHADNSVSPIVAKLILQRRPSALHGAGPDFFASAENATAFSKFALAHSLE